MNRVEEIKMRTMLSCILMLVSIPLFAKQKPSDNSSLCKIKTLFENPVRVEKSEQQIKDAISRGENEPDTMEQWDRDFWPAIKETIGTRTWMKVADFDSKLPEGRDDVGIVSFWRSSIGPMTDTLEAGPTEASMRSGHGERYSLSIRDAHGNLLWQKEGRGNFVGDVYTVSGTTVLQGHEASVSPNLQRVLDALVKRLAKEAGCR
jgi:hypothetical protein